MLYKKLRFLRLILDAVVLEYFLDVRLNDGLRLECLHHLELFYAFFIPFKVVIGIRRYHHRQFLGTLLPLNCTDILFLLAGGFLLGNCDLRRLRILNTDFCKTTSLTNLRRWLLIINCLIGIIDSEIIDLALKLFDNPFELGFFLGVFVLLKVEYVFVLSDGMHEHLREIVIGFEGIREFLLMQL